MQHFFQELKKPFDSAADLAEKLLSNDYTAVFVYNVLANVLLLPSVAESGDSVLLSKYATAARFNPPVRVPDLDTAMDYVLKKKKNYVYVGIDTDLDIISEKYFDYDVTIDRKLESSPITAFYNPSIPIFENISYTTIKYSLVVQERLNSKYEVINTQSASFQYSESIKFSQVRKIFEITFAVYCLCFGVILLEKLKCTLNWMKMRSASKYIMRSVVNSFSSNKS